MGRGRSLFRMWTRIGNLSPDKVGARPSLKKAFLLAAIAPTRSSSTLGKPGVASLIQLRIERPSTLETDLYPPIKRHLERLGLAVKGEVCGCDLVALSEGSPELVVIGEMKQSFTLELVLQAVDRTSIWDEVWLAVRASKWGRGRENDARVKKLCRFLGFGLLTVTADGRVDVVAEPAPWKPRRDAKRRSRIVEEYRRRKGDPVAGGSSDATNDGLSSAGARRGQRACQHVEVVRGTFGYLLRTPPRSFRAMSMAVRADRTGALWAYVVRSCRASHMGRSCFRRGERQVWRRPVRERMM